MWRRRQKLKWCTYKTRTTKTTSHDQKPAARHQQTLPLSPKAGIHSADILISKSRREEILVVSSYWVCGHLSEQSQEIHTKGKHELNYEVPTVWGSHWWRAWWKFILERLLQPWRKDDTGEETAGRRLLQQRGAVISTNKAAAAEKMDPRAVGSGRKFGFFCNILWKNLNELFGQLNTQREKHIFWGPTVSNGWKRGKNRAMNPVFPAQVRAWVIAPSVEIKK